MSGRGLSRSLFVLGAVLLLTPLAAIANHGLTVGSLPSTLQPNTSYPLTISASSGNCCGGNSSTITITSSPNVTLSTNSYSIGASDTRTIIVTTGAASGPVSVTVQHQTIFGTQTVTRTATLAGQGTSSFIPGTTNAISVGTSRTVTISLSSFATQPVTFNLSASPSGSATLPSSVTVPAGANNASFTVVGQSQGDFTIAGSSTSAAYASPASVTLRSSGTMNPAPGTFCCVASGGTTPINVGLVRFNPFGAIPTNVPFTTGLVISGPASAGTTLSVSTLNFAAGDTTKTVTLSGGPNIGDITLSFTNPGANPYLNTMLSAPFKVQGKVSIANAPASLEVGASAPITVQLSHASINTFTVNLSLGGNAGGASLSQTSVTFNAGEQSKVVTVTAGPTPSDTPLTIHGFVPGNPASLYFANIATSASLIVTRTTAPTPTGTNVTVVPPMPDGGTVSLKVTFDEVTAAGQTKLLNATPIPAPSGYQVPGIPLYFALSTTASTSGQSVICAGYAGATTPDETGLRLMKWDGTSWTNITQSVNTTGDFICGDGSPLDGSTFAIFGLNSAPIVGAIDGPDGISVAGEPRQFSAPFSDMDASDTHTGVWVWGDGTTSPATISNGIATGEHAFAGGTYQVRLVISDGGQQAASPDFQVIADGAAPVINSLTATPGSLWEPNSKMYDVALTIVATDDTGTPVCTVTGVSAVAQNVKQTAYAITGAMSVQLKAFPHTTYTVTVECGDAVGRKTQKTVDISVAKIK